MRCGAGAQTPSGKAEQEAHEKAAVGKGCRVLVGGNLTGAPGHRESQVPETVFLGGGSLGRLPLVTGEMALHQGQSLPFLASQVGQQRLGGYGADLAPADAALCDRAALRAC